MFNAPITPSRFGSRAMTDEELQDFLKHVRYGTLSYTGDEGWPDSRVFNFGLLNGKFYFHSHKVRGEKLPFISNGQKACISFYEPSPDVGLMRYCQHRSALVYGTVERIDKKPEYHDEAMDGLRQMCLDGGTPFKASPEKFEIFSKTCAIFRFTPVYAVGKLTIFTSLPEMSYLEQQHYKLMPKPE